MLCAVRPEAPIVTVDALKLCCDVGVRPIRRRDQPAALTPWLLRAQPGIEKAWFKSPIRYFRIAYRGPNVSIFWKAITSWTTTQVLGDESPRGRAPRPLDRSLQGRGVDHIAPAGA